MVVPKLHHWLAVGIIATTLLLTGGSVLAGERHGSLQQGSSLLIAQADKLQFNHEFDAALTLLDQVIARGHQHQQARLMQARILLAQGRIEAAEESCMALMGKSSLTLSASCLLEVKGRKAYTENDQAQLAATYAQLQKIALPERPSAHDEVFVWQRQLLAEQAFILQRYQESAAWLAYTDYATHPTVNQIRLLDNWLALEQPEKVFTVHSRCPQIGALPEDSVIVRLADAEQRLQSATTCWQKLAKERMAIRVARNDPLHTSDIAYYFIHVEPDSVKAQRYAEQNYAVAREPADARLLLAAQQLEETTHEH